MIRLWERGRKWKECKPTKKMKNRHREKNVWLMLVVTIEPFSFIFFPLNLWLFSIWFSLVDCFTRRWMVQDGWRKICNIFYEIWSIVAQEVSLVVTNSMVQHDASMRARKQVRWCVWKRGITDDLKICVFLGFSVFMQFRRE